MTGHYDSTLTTRGQTTWCGTGNAGALVVSVLLWPPSSQPAGQPPMAPPHCWLAPMALVSLMAGQAEGPTHSQIHAPGLW